MRAGPPSRDGSTDASRQVLVRKSVDRADSGVSVYQWTAPNGIAMMLVSTIPAADTRRVVDSILGHTLR